MKKRIVKRMFAAFLSAIMVVGDMNIPVLAAEKTVSEDTVSVNETENDFLVETEEISDFSISDEELGEEIEASENEIEVFSEEDYSASEDLEIVTEENWDGNDAGDGTAFDTAPDSSWGSAVIVFTGSDASSRHVNNIFIQLWSTNTTPSTSGSYKMLIYGKNTSGTLDLSTATWETMLSHAVRGLTVKTNGSWECGTLSNYVSCVNEIAVRNINSMSGAASVFASCSNCTKISFCDKTSSSGGNQTRVLSSLTGTPFKGMTKLQSVVLPACVTSLSDGYFQNCSSLTSVTGNTFTSIPANCFYGCTSLTSAPTAVASATSAGANAFYNCTALTSIPASLTSIGASAFRGCTKLSSVNISATSIGDYAFYGDSAITSASLGSASTIGAQAFRGCKISSLSLKSGCSIGEYAFYGNNLSSVDVSGLSLGAGVFQYNSNLKTVTCNAFVGTQFTGCPITSVTIKSGGTLNSGLGTFASTLTTVNAPNVTALGDSALSGCSRVTSMTFGNLTSVGTSALSGCSNVNQNTIDISKLTSIGTNAFANTGVTKVTLNSSVSSWPNAFSGCKLTSITIPGIQAIPVLTAFKSTLTEVVANSATSVVASAFTGCTLLNTVTIPNVKTVGESAFSNCTKITQSNLDISKFTSIGLNAFQNTGITQVTLNSALTDFPSAFSGCKLTSVTMPGAESIGTNKFSGFKATLTTIDGENVTSLGESAFDGCTALKTVSLPKLKTIGKGSFRGCTALTSADYSNVETVGDEAFQGCTGITSITFAKAKTIGASAFEGCSKLATLALDTVSTIEENAFANCPIKALSLEHILTIGQGAFSGCSQLKSASVETATTIYKNAFYGCENLSALSLRDITLVEENAFNGIGAALDSQPVIAIPATKNISIGYGAFDGNLAYVTYDGTEDKWKAQISLGGTQKEVFCEAYILFNDGKKLYPDDPTSTTTDPDGPTDPDEPVGPTDPDEPTDTPTPSPSSGDNGTVTADNLLDTIPDTSDKDATKKWLEDAGKYGEDTKNNKITEAAKEGLENIDDPEKRDEAVETILMELEDNIEDTISSLIDDKPDYTDKVKTASWFRRVKKFSKDNKNDELKTAANDALDDIDDKDARKTNINAIIEKLEDVEKTEDTPTPTPSTGTEDEDPNVKYYSVAFYTYYDKAAKLYTERVVEGGSVINVPKAEYSGYTFVGWYEVSSLGTGYPVRWYVGTPVYRNIVLCAMFTDDNGNVKIAIPNTEFPIKGEFDMGNLPGAIMVTPGDGSANNITNITFNMLPSNGFGNLNASGLDGFIDFSTVTKDDTKIYMVKGQKVKDTSVTMETSDKKILKVSKDGKTVTAKKEGTVTLTITNGSTGKKVKAKVIITAPKMSVKKVSAEAGKTSSISLACGSYTNNYPIYWSSSNVDVAYIEPSTNYGTAIVHGMSKGSAIITAYVNGKAYKCSVKVSEGEKSTNPRTVHLNVGKTAKAAPAKVPVKKAVWTSSNQDVATVVNGKIKGVKAGNALITAKYEGVTYRYYVYVEDPSVVNNSSVRGTGKKYSVNLGAGKLTTLKVVYANQPVVFVSKNPEIAFVDQNGFVRGRSTGKTNITTKINKLSIKVNTVID